MFREKRKELQEMSIERRLATLNITESRTPVPPPRNRRLLKQHHSLPDKMATSPPKQTQELYAERSYSFGSDPKYITIGLADDRQDNEYSDSITQRRPDQAYYSKYEGAHKTKQELHIDTQPMCDIIQSSQRKSGMQPQHRPDILRASFKADIQSKLATSSHANHDPGLSKRPQYNFRQEQTDDKNYNFSGKHSRRNTDKTRRHDRCGMDGGSTSDQPRVSHQGTRIMSGGRAYSVDPSAHDNNRYIFYRPNLDDVRKQNTVIGLPGVTEAGYDPEMLCSSTEGSFTNPAFEISDISKSPKKMAGRLNTSPAKPSRPTYSTMGGSYSTRPCTPSPPSHRFRQQKPPLPASPEQEISISKSLGPTPIKPMLSAQRVEASLKQYPSPSKINTNDMCSSQAMENMMKYYKIEDDNPGASPSRSPLSNLSSSKKTQSPYSSTGSLNVCGDSIDVVLRRKKKVKIRPPSISSDDEAIKRVSLEINLAPGANTSKEQTIDSTETISDRRKSISGSQTSLNQAVEKLDLEDLTSTEAAKLLRKQFAKLKVKANNLKVKDNELKQRFALLQNQRGRVCGHGGGVTKSKTRNSQIAL
ncbi:uncharacterized protein [Watersipora subatra]|uniref:uncharacterized protein isoform X2 n=1 Tax=Watersipora subatra TaxID=2589382 RepID=UPI00355BE131